MRKANCVIQLTIGVLISIPGLADDANLGHSNGDPIPVANPSAEVWRAELNAVTRSLPLQPSKAMGYTHRNLQTIPDFDFQDATVLTRFSKVRSLALVTVAETRQARLFLGVNNDGIVGLHLGALPRRGAVPHLELLRMPYLKKQEPDR